LYQRLVIRDRKIKSCALVDFGICPYFVIEPVANTELNVVDDLRKIHQFLSKQGARNYGYNNIDSIAARCARKI